MQSLDELFRQVEEENAQRTRTEMAKEQQVWDDYSDEQRARISQSRAERLESLFDLNDEEEGD